MRDARSSPLDTIAPAAGLGLLLLVALWPALGDLSGRFLGASTDALHHAWGLWWFRADGREGAITPLVSFPTGERGALLSPLLTWGSVPWAMLGGPALAYNAATAGVLLGSALGVGLLARRLVGSTAAGALAALAMLVGRPMLAQLGLGVLEGLLLGPAAAVVWGLLVWVESTPPPREGWRRWAPWTWPGSLALGLGAAVAVMENPYTLPLLAPATALAAGIRLRRHRWAALPPVLAALLAGLGGVALRLVDAGGDLGGNAVVSVHFRWAGRWWSALEGEAGLDPTRLVWPWPVVDLAASAAQIHAAGGHLWLGWTVLALAAVGAVLGGGVGRAGLGVAALALLLAAGSLPGGQRGLPGPFFFLNLAISQVLPPLTQPVRFLSLASAALGVSAAAGASALARRLPERDVWAMTALALTLEGLWLGGPSLEMPVTDLREVACFADLDREVVGAVHLAPPRGLDAERANTAAIELQLLHRLPGTHRGVGGWTREPPTRGWESTVKTVNLSLQRQTSSPALWSALRAMEGQGVAWLVISTEATPTVLPSPRRSCGGWSAWRLSDLTGR